jgi:hypothetical protein
MCISMATWLVVGSISTGSIVTVGVSRWRKLSTNHKLKNKNPD